MNTDHNNPAPDSKENKPATNVSAVDQYFGGVGLAVTRHGEYIAELRKEYPVWGTIATPFYMYYSMMVAPFAGCLYRDTFAKYAQAAEQSPDADLEGIGFERVTFVDNKRPRVTPTPKNLKKIGITSTIVGGLLLLGLFAGSSSDED